MTQGTSSKIAVDGVYYVVANPSAKSGRGDSALREVESRLKARGVRPEIRRTQGPGDAARLAEEATRAGAACVVALGGDGMIHNVLNGILAARAESPPVLGVVPVGTGNDYAKMLGVPSNEPERAAEVLLAGTPRAVDVGRIEGAARGPEYFCNNVGLAFLAEANAAHERNRRLPGRMSYALGGLAAWFRWRAELLTVNVDDVSLQGRFMAVHVAIGSYCGGGVNLTPEASLEDGQFHVCVVAECGKVGGMLKWPRISRGEPTPDVTVLKGKQVSVHGPRDMLLHADGEVRTVPTGVLELTLLPGALRVLHAAR